MIFYKRIMEEQSKKNFASQEKYQTLAISWMSKLCEQ